MKEVDYKEYGIEEVRAKQIMEQFTPMLERMAELEEQANKVFQLDIESKQAAVEARELRLQYVKVRTGTALIHKNQKAFYLAAGKYVDGWKNTQLFAGQGMENRLLEIENHLANKEKERKLALAIEREEECKKFIEHEFELLAREVLADMDEVVWDGYILGLESAKNLRIKIKMDAQQAEEKRLEEARLQQIQDEETRLERERIESERYAKMKEKAKKEKALKDRARVAMKKADEKAVMLAAQLKKKKDAEIAEQKRIREVELAERKKARLEALAPEKDRINNWISSSEMKEFSTKGMSPEGRVVVESIERKFIAFQNWAHEQIGLIK